MHLGTYFQIQFDASGPYVLGFFKRYMVWQTTSLLMCHLTYRCSRSGNCPLTLKKDQSTSWSMFGSLEE